MGSRLHEYGGGAYLPSDIGDRNGHTLLVSCLSDDRQYRLGPGQPPRPITPSPSASAVLRYAD